MTTIVVADDSPTLRRILRGVLGRAGHEVVETVDGLVAVQAALARQPDAVVLDVHMPRMSGFLAARLLKDDWRTAHIPVVILTSSVAAAHRAYAAHAGADRYLTKDFEAPELVEALAALLSGPTTPPSARPDPVDVPLEQILARACDLLDQRLFEASTAQAVMADGLLTAGDDVVAEALLDALHRFVTYDLAAVLLAGNLRAHVAAPEPSGAPQLEGFLDRCAQALAGATGRPVARGDLDVRTPAGWVAPQPDAPAGTFLSMPLRDLDGAVTGLLGLSSARPNAFGETALSTLRVVAGPAGRVVERLHRLERGLPAG